MLRITGWDNFIHYGKHMTEILVFIQQWLASGTHIVAKGLTKEVPPSVVLFFRSFVAASIYSLWMLLSPRKVKRIETRDWIWLFVLGALNIPINQYLFLMSIRLTSPPNVALAYALTPGFVLMIAMAFQGEKATGKKIAGIIIAIIGTGIVLFEKGVRFGSEGFWGDVLALLASISWAVYTVMGKKYSEKYGAIYTTGLTMITGFILYLPLFMALPDKINLGGISYVNWLQILYLGAITSGMAYAIWYYALKKSDASKVSVFNNLQPIFTTILSIIFFGFGLTLPFISGSLLIIFGIILTQRG